MTNQPNTPGCAVNCGVCGTELVYFDAGNTRGYTCPKCLPAPTATAQTPGTGIETVSAEEAGQIAIRIKARSIRTADGLLIQRLAATIESAASASITLAEENERLRKIVDALPRTADGVTIVPGLTVYEFSELLNEANPVAFVGYELFLRNHGWMQTYSTKEACEAAALAARSTEGSGLQTGGGK